MSTKKLTRRGTVFRGRSFDEYATKMDLEILRMTIKSDISNVESGISKLDAKFSGLMMGHTFAIVSAVAMIVGFFKSCH